MTNAPKTNKILVITPNFLGDSILSEIFFKNLKKYYKNSTIDVITKSNIKSIYELFPYIDNVYDRKAKKFKAVSEESPKEMHEYVKKVSDKFTSTGARLKNSAKYGGIAALAIAGGALLSAWFFGRKS